MLYIFFILKFTNNITIIIVIRYMPKKNNTRRNDHYTTVTTVTKTSGAGTGKRISPPKRIRIYNPISQISSSSRSRNSNSNSSDSLRTKHMKKMGLAFSMNKFLDEDMTDVILRQYYNDTPYELINELQKIYPFEHDYYTMYAEYFGLNPRIHLLVPKIVKRIEDDSKGCYDPKVSYRTKEQKLIHFYHNLAKNTSKKVIPYLKKIYDDNPDSKKLNWPALCKNPNAIEILKEEYEKEPNKLVWSSLCENSKAIDILKEEYEKEPNKLVWSSLCKNPKAISILTREYEKEPNKLVWSALCENSKAIDILTREYEKEPNKLEWSSLCENSKAIDILTREYEKEPNKLVWSALCKNPKAIDILTREYEKEPNKLVWSSLCENKKALGIIKEEYNKVINNINWNSLSGNINPKAITLLKKKTLHINWDILSGNPSAIELIIDRLRVEKQNQYYTHANASWIDIKKKIVWSKLLANPSIFTINQGPL